MKKRDQIRIKLIAIAIAELITIVLCILHYRYHSKTAFLSSIVILIESILLLRYDFKRRKNKIGAGLRPPLIITSENRELLDELLEECKKDIPVKETEHCERPLALDRWICSCGRANPGYTSTCVCGKQKRCTPTKLPRKSIRRHDWVCQCGRTNIFDVSVCLCGEKRSDALNEKELKAMGRFRWLCPCGSINPGYTSTCACGRHKRDILSQYNQTP